MGVVVRVAGRVPVAAAFYGGEVVQSRISRLVQISHREQEEAGGKNGGEPDRAEPPGGRGLERDVVVADAVVLENYHYGPQNVAERAAEHGEEHLRENSNLHSSRQRLPVPEPRELAQHSRAVQNDAQSVERESAGLGDEQGSVGFGDLGPVVEGVVGEEQEVDADVDGEAEEDSVDEKHQGEEDGAHSLPVVDQNRPRPENRHEGESSDVARDAQQVEHVERLGVVGRTPERHGNVREALEEHVEPENEVEGLAQSERVASAAKQVVEEPVAEKKKKKGKRGGKREEGTGNREEGRRGIGSGGGGEKGKGKGKEERKRRREGAT